LRNIAVDSALNLFTENGNSIVTEILYLLRFRNNPQKFISNLEVSSEKFLPAPELKKIIDDVIASSRRDSFTIVQDKVTSLVALLKSVGHLTTVFRLFELAITNPKYTITPENKEAVNALCKQLGIVV
jgi:hypothetical protein